MSAPSRLHTMYVFLLINPQSSKKKKKDREKEKEIKRNPASQKQNFFNSRNIYTYQ